MFTQDTTDNTEATSPQLIWICSVMSQISKSPLLAPKCVSYFTGQLEGTTGMANIPYAHHNTHQLCTYLQCSVHANTLGRIIELESDGILLQHCNEIILMSPCIREYKCTDTCSLSKEEHVYVYTHKHKCIRRSDYIKGADNHSLLIIHECTKRLTLLFISTKKTLGDHHTY